jgi:hypothetical protein
MRWHSCMLRELPLVGCSHLVIIDAVYRSFNWAAFRRHHAYTGFGPAGWSWPISSKRRAPPPNPVSFLFLDHCCAAAATRRAASAVAVPVLRGDFSSSARLSLPAPSLIFLSSPCRRTWEAGTQGRVLLPAGVPDSIDQRRFGRKSWCIRSYIHVAPSASSFGRAGMFLSLEGGCAGTLDLLWTPHVRWNAWVKLLSFAAPGLFYRLVAPGRSLHIFFFVVVSYHNVISHCISSLAFGYLDFLVLLQFLR